MDLHLHLGAHKTASTLLQKHLSRHSKELLAVGVNWKGPAEVRTSLVKAVHKMCAQNDMSRPEFAKLQQSVSETLFPEADLQICAISDENLIGGCRKAFDQTGFYPRIGMRLKMLRRLLPEAPTRVFFAVRSPETFIPSAYCEVLVHAQTYIPFSTFFAGATPTRLLWYPVIEVIQRTFPDSQIVVWCYEDFQCVLEALLFLLLGPAGFSAIPMLPTDKRNRPSLSSLAVNLLDQCSSLVAPDDFGRFVACLRKTFPKSATHPGIDPKELHHHSWTDQYQQDLDRIKALSSVMFLQA
jgi:hypothetical protein